VRNRLPASVPLAIVIFAAVTAVALRAAARRAEAPGIPGADSARVTAMTVDSRPNGLAEQVQYVFHELHADGHHALCGICDNQYRR
jgi:hypothetical protein